MFRLKIYGNELKEAESCIFDNFENVKSVIIKLYNNFIKNHPRYRVEFVMKGADGGLPLFMCIEDISNNDINSKHIMIDVQFISKI